MSSSLLKTIVAGLVLALVVSVLVGPILGATGSNIDGSVGLGADGERAFASGPNITDVRSSTGRALSLSQDAELQVSGGLGVSGSTWTWSTAAAVDDPSRDQVVWSVRDEWILAYNSTDPSWMLWHYNASSTNSYRVSVPASDATNLTTVQITRNASTVTLYNGTGTTSSFSETPGTTKTAPAPTYGSLDGRLEETQVWGRVLNSSQLQQKRTAPNQPIPVDRRSRLMMDTTGKSVVVDLRSASAEVVGGYPLLEDPRRQGFAGVTLAEGTDYQLADQNGVTLTMIGTWSKMPRVVIQTAGGGGGSLPGFASAIGVLGFLSVLVLFWSEMRSEL